MAGIQGIHHVKLPVSDVDRSRDWYERVFGLELLLEFVEDGVLMGVALADPDHTVAIGLRGDPDRAKALAGFDPLAIGVPSLADLEAWRDHLASLGEKHDGIVERPDGHVLLGLHDPDGIEIRLYTADKAAG
ncbi:MAG TPA: VOC family protein [Actinophytocola sp.]|jgi:catechol 2,3-dioxygenase-like lactoylglutathione lyase family enzyme|uniref:VOC family protein n=1 Tax=Actinophytocola sp. TaxID=1872138 RepID=UPI002F92D3BF